MKTEAFIDLLEDRQLVSERVTRQLRAKITQGDHRITADSILKYLVKKELLTRRQAKELMETALVVTQKSESSILGLVPLPDIEENSAPKRPAPTFVDDDEAPVPLKPMPKAKDAKPSPQPPAAPPAARAKNPPPANDELFVVESNAPAVEPLGGMGDEYDGEATADKPSSLSPRLGGSLSGAKKKGKRTKRPVKDRGRNQWDSPLLLVGGGGLVVLLVAGVILWYLLFRESADSLLAKANSQFESQAYPQAIESYTNFVGSYSSHKDYSRAKVRLEMTKLWQAVDSPGDPADALAVAQQVVSAIEDEPAFISDTGAQGEGLSESKRELSGLLMRLAKSLNDEADKADEKSAPGRIKQLETILALCANSKYVPERYRNAAELAAARETLDRVQARQKREADLAAGMVKMDAAVAKGDTAEAYGIRSELLSQYPVLRDNEALAGKVREISAAAKGRVKFIKSAQPAATDTPTSAVVAEIALAERRGRPAAGAPTEPVIVRVEGALFGLNAADGALLWRRYVGPDATAYPLVLPNGKVFSGDVTTHGLVCLDSKTGKLLWRLPIDDELTTPTVVGSRLLVGGKSGKLFVIEAETGALVGYVELPQPIRLPPVANDRGDRIYVVADHSTLVTLAAEDYSCLGVYYLGHAPGSIAAPPIAVLNKIVVAENSGAESCQLHVLSLDKDGAAAADVAGGRLAGLVATPLAVDRRRFAAVTTLGQAVVYEVAAGDDAKSLIPMASRDAQEDEQVASYGLLREGHLWMAGRQLMKLAVLPTGNQLSVGSLDRDYQGDSFDYLLQSAGNLIIHVRRPAGRAGAIVAATIADADRSAWETELGTPLAGPPAIDAVRARIAAPTASGAAFLLEREAISAAMRTGAGVDDSAFRAGNVLEEKMPYTASVDLGGGRMAIGAPGGTRLLRFHPDNPRDPLTAIILPSALSCPPVQWRNGFVAATDAGQVILFDSNSAEKVGTPFQPELAPDRQFHWLQPAVAGDGDRSLLLISDGAEKLYALTFKPAPAQHLEAASTVDVGPSALVSPLAVAGSRVFAGTKDGGLASFNLPDLKPNDSISLGGQVIWGPHTTSRGLLMALDTQELVFASAEGSIVWRRPLKHGDLVGSPLLAGGEVVLLHPHGGLERVNLTDGAETAYVDLGQPATAGPVALGERWLVGSADGALLVVTPN